MRMGEFRDGAASLWDSVAEGWQRLRESAAGVLTRFRPSEKSNLPAARDVDDETYVPTQGWSMLGGDVFEDDQRLVVRLEVPGMNKQDFDIEVRDDVLLVRGEKRFERETTTGRYRVLQCAYGSFLRAVPLPVPVRSDKAAARYRDGVLKIELPKIEAGGSKRLTLKVS